MSSKIYIPRICSNRYYVIKKVFKTENEAVTYLLKTLFENNEIYYACEKCSERQRQEWRELYNEDTAYDNDECEPCESNCEYLLPELSEKITTLDELKEFVKTHDVSLCYQQSKKDSTYFKEGSWTIAIDVVELE